MIRNASNEGTVSSGCHLSSNIPYFFSMLHSTAVELQAGQSGLNSDLIPCVSVS